LTVVVEYTYNANKSIWIKALTRKSNCVD